MSKAMEFKFDQDADTGGVSYNYVNVYASIETMTRVFGASQAPFERVTHKWSFSGPFSATVYDYNYDGAYSGEWHVGTDDLEQAEQFKRWFDRKIQSVK